MVFGEICTNLKFGLSNSDLFWHLIFLINASYPIFPYNHSIKYCRPFRAPAAALNADF
jgi:hypothetical protein